MSNNKQKPSRNHHYIPQAYLKEFTDTEEKTGSLYVYDLKRNISYQTTPKNVGVERDFNRIDTYEGIPFDIMEKELADVEADIIPAIKRIKETSEYPNDDDWTRILHIITFLSIRNPITRSMMLSIREDQIDEECRSLVSSEEYWNKTKNELKLRNSDLGNNLTYDELKKFVYEKEYMIDFPPGYTMQLELEKTLMLLPELAKRNWSLLISPEDCPEFISSNFPVILCHRNNPEINIGFASKDSFVFFPLTKRLAFLGHFSNGDHKIGVLKVEGVARWNSLMFNNKGDQIYSSSPEITLLNKNDEIIKLELETKNKK